MAHQINLARVSIWAPFYRLWYSFCWVIYGLPMLDLRKKTFIMTRSISQRAMNLQGILSKTTE